MSNSVAPHKAITKLFVFAYLMGVILQAVSESERGSKQKQKNGKQKTENIHRLSIATSAR